ncbi:MAG: type I glyceraldehyde-3-phosphate dehydrogenase [Candidatus Alcyoniella australis]|nr:type I glyceraldehyde-3-phosphate dehydrogenase [Candidatus Alcyoniella australis]
MAVKIGINGFGRIGRSFLRAIGGRDDIDCVAINDLTDPKTLGHLFKYDSVMGPFNGTIEVESDAIIINGKPIKVMATRDPAQLPWAELGVEIVLEATGLFRSGETAGKHIAAGAKRVVISAPGKDIDGTFVMGVNEGDYDPEKHFIISNASCTTNCLAPIAKVLDETVGIEHGLMTTIHSYTNDQRLLDFPHKDLRRARAAAVSMIPTTTGAAKAVALVLPQLEGKLNGIAIRVPTPNVSLVDLNIISSRATSAEQINGAIAQAAQGALKPYVRYSDEPLVSVDFMQDPHSSIFDAENTMVIGGRMVKVLAWYDNEWGYSCRLADLIAYISN